MLYKRRDAYMISDWCFGILRLYSQRGDCWVKRQVLFITTSCRFSKTLSPCKFTYAVTPSDGLIMELRKKEHGKVHTFTLGILNRQNLIQ